MLTACQRVMRKDMSLNLARVKGLKTISAKVVTMNSPKRGAFKIFLKFFEVERTSSLAVSEKTARPKCVLKWGKRI